MVKPKTTTATAPRLKALYTTQYVKELQTELGLDNVHQVPKLEKIVVSVGIGKNKDDKRHYEAVKNTLTKVTGQAPVDRMAKKSIAGFKIRAGMNRVGINVTLRGAVCTNSSTDLLMSLCLAYATSMVSAQNSIVAATTTSASPTKASSQNYHLKKLSLFTVCKSPSPSKKATK